MVPKPFGAGILLPKSLLKLASVIGVSAIALSLSGCLGDTGLSQNTSASGKSSY